MTSLLNAIPPTYSSSLLLNCNGANNSTVFTDSGKNSLSITPSGNAKISTTQSKFGGSSAYFDSSPSTCLRCNHSDFNFGNSNFTIDCWIRLDNIVGTHGICAKRSDSGTYGGFSYGIFDNQLSIVFTSNGTTWDIIINPTFSLSANTWYHLALVRNGKFFKVYVDGFECYTYISTTGYTILSNSDNLTIGAGANDGTQLFAGYIDDFRIIKGVALYTGSYFPIPTTEAKKNVDKYQSLTNHITMISTKTSGNITGTISTTSNYYTVQYWDGTKTIYASNSSFSKAATSGSKSITIYPSSSDGTILGLFNNVNLSNNGLTSIRPYYTKFSENPAYFKNGWNQGYWYPTSYGSTWRTRYISGYTVPASNYFLDVSSNSLSSSALNSIYYDLLPGSGSLEVSDNPGSNSDSPDIATNKGYSVYGSFAPFVSLLLHFNGANNSASFYDSSTFNHIPIGHGNAEISTTQSKFGGSSAYFDGTGDYLSLPANSVFAMGSEDFTIECWAYPVNWPASDLASILDSRSFGGGDGLLLSLIDTQKWGFYCKGDGIERGLSSIDDAVLNDWSHLAVSRKNGKIYFFVNGILVDSKGVEGTPEDLSPGNTSIILIGTAADDIGNSRMYNGYIDDLRIIKGKALYLNNFDPPTSELGTIV